MGFYQLNTYWVFRVGTLSMSSLGGCSYRTLIQSHKDDEDIMET